MRDITGTTLGKYQILEEIGRGGMGAVYKAYDPTLDRYVAIKVLAPHLVWEQEFLQRFFQEARAAAKLRHPNIVTVYDIGEQEGTYYIVMEYIEGKPLSEIIRREGPLPPERAARILEQVASALEAAHQKGLVHRDVKPGNILIGPGDRAILTDFGIARALTGTRLTRTGMMIGTPGYISPEQVRGEEVGPAADQYALGVVAYEMLTGRPPFEGDTATLLYKHANEMPLPLRGINPRVPPGVEKVVLRALAKRPEERWPTVAAFARALALPGAGELIGAGKEGGPIRSGPLALAIALGGATILGVLIVFLGIIFLVMKSMPGEPVPTPPAAAQVAPSVTAMEAITEIATRAFTPLAKTPSLTPTFTSAPLPSPTNTPVRTVAPQSQGLPVPVQPRLAFASDRTGNVNLYIFSVGQSKVERTVPPPGEYENALWPSWCKGSLFFEANTEDKLQWIYSLKVDTGTLRPWKGAPEWARRIGVPKCSPKGTYLAYSATFEEELRPQSWPMVLADASGRRFALVSDGWMNAHATWSYDESSVYYVHADEAGERLYIHKAEVADLFAGAEKGYDVTQLFTSDGEAIDNVKYLSLSPDGRHMAFTCKIEEIWGLCIWDIETGDVHRLVKQVYWEHRYLKNKLLAPKGTLDWSPDGEWIAYSSDQDGDWDIYLIRPDGSEERNLTEGWPSNEVMPVWEK